MAFKYAGKPAICGVYLIMEYIPSYKIEGFEGPLDLLLQLIARNKLNIYDIQLSVLIDQYLAQIELFRSEEDKKRISRNGVKAFIHQDRKSAAAP